MLMLGYGSIIARKNGERGGCGSSRIDQNGIKNIRAEEIDFDQVHEGFKYHRRMLEELNNVE